MATNTEVGVKITVDGAEAKKSVGDIKKELREATKELEQSVERFGKYSNEAKNAAKNVLDLKKEVAESKKLTDAFNPDVKFRAFGAALQGLVGGFTAVQGALALFGSESDEVNKSLEKVQGALALSQGVDQVLEAKKSFEDLGKVLRTFPIIQKAIAAAQYVWNAATAANPIGALVAVVVALIAAGAALIKFFIDSSKESKKNEAAIKANAKALEEQSKQADKNAEQLQRNQKYQLELAKANGATAKEIRALELKLIDEKIAMYASARATALSTFEKEKNYLATLKQNDASDEQIKKQQEVTNKSLEEANKQTKNLNDANVEKGELIRKQTIEVINENKKANEDAIKKGEELRQKKKEQAEEARKAELELQGELRSLRNEATLLEIKDENERAKKKIQFDLEDRIRQINSTKATQATKKALIEEETKKANLATAKIDTDAKNETIKKEEDFQNQLNALIVQNQIKATKDARQREILEQQDAFYQKRQAILNNAITDSEEKKALLEQLAVSERLASEELKTKFDTEDFNRERDKLNVLIQNDKLSAEVRLKAITDEEALLKKSFDNKIITEQQYNSQLQELSNSRKKIDELESEQKITNAKAIGDAISQVGQLFGEETAAAKTAAVASSAINTYAAAWTAFTQGQKNPISIAFPAYPYIQAGVAVAGGLANIKKILAVKTPKGGGGGGSVPSGGGINPPPTVPPLTPQTQTTLLNQGQVNQIGNVAARAYVVESDVSGNQQRIQRLERAARIA